MIVADGKDLYTAEELALLKNIPIEEVHNAGKKALLQCVLGLQAQGMTLPDICEMFVRILEDGK